MPRWTRRDFLGAAAATPVAAAACSGARPQDGPPHIVYIYTDQHRAPLLGSYGHPDALTPHIDALAAEGVLFEHCFTNAPICRPARATMMSGLLPSDHGCWNNNQFADRRGESHVRRMRDAGWHTAMIGKSHLDLVMGDASQSPNTDNLRAWGFEDSLELLSQPTTVVKPNAYMEWLAETTPAGDVPKTQRHKGYVNAWEHLIHSPPPDAEPYRLSTDDHLDVFCGRRAADWIRTRAGSHPDTPFYLQVNLPGPHSPFDATSEFRELYDEAQITLPILGEPPTDRGALVAFLHETKPELHGLTEADARFLLMTYLSKITLIDFVVGEVVAAIEEAGIADHTWIVYGSDHGELAGDHELWGKVAMYEGSLRIPFIVRPPGGTSPWRTNALVDQRDVTATILGIAGESGPGGGTSQLPRIEAGPDAAGAQTGREHVVAQIAGHPQGSLRTAMVRSERHKLVYNLDDGVAEELYDLDADPVERDNRIADPDQATTVNTLRNALLDQT
ncbi:MAG: sulfatase-like hydrolase/transferase [Myxococcales bacterium]|nr:sulfatase-like hydrolase/transferase [Myxococcales bacterium]